MECYDGAIISCGGGMTRAARRRGLLMYICIYKYTGLGGYGVLGFC